MGHITIDELTARVKGTTEANNGLLNRFLCFAVRREKLIPRPPRTNPEFIIGFAEEIKTIYEFIKNQKQFPIEMQVSQEADLLFYDKYKELSVEQVGTVGYLSSRYDTYVLMLAMIFALLDKSIVIEKIHIQTACYWIDYATQSLDYIFTNSEIKAKEEGISSLAVQILEKLKEKPLSRKEIGDALHRNKSSDEIKEALEFLLNQSPSKIKIDKISTGKRPKEIISCI